MSALGLYVHIPFCPQRCPYCVFTSVAGATEHYDRYVAAVQDEITVLSEVVVGRQLDTIFFGGGTPSMLAPHLLQGILERAENKIGLKDNVEITLEANPGTEDVRRFTGYRRGGFNRLSIGVQSFVDATLRSLGRIHTAADALSACKVARRAGFDNLNIDIMFGVPGVPPAHWQYSLETAINLAPEHVSAYGLTVEEGTVLAEGMECGRELPLDEDQDLVEYELVLDTMAGAGYEHYEVSNFATPGRRARHNWNCWQGGEYIGVGLAAHSHVSGRRCWNERHLETYMCAIEAGCSAEVGNELVDAPTAHRERIWMGLRTSEGISLSPGQCQLLAEDGRFRSFTSAGLLQLCGDNLRLTRRGFLVADPLGTAVLDLLDVPQSRSPDVDLMKVMQTR